MPLSALCTQTRAHIHTYTVSLSHTRIIHNQFNRAHMHCTRLHAHMCARSHTDANTDAGTHTHAHTRTHTHRHTHTRTCTHTLAQARTHTHMHAHTRTGTHTHAHARLCTHTPQHIHTSVKRLEVLLSLLLRVDGVEDRLPLRLVSLLQLLNLILHLRVEGGEARGELRVGETSHLRTEGGEGVRGR